MIDEQKIDEEIKEVKEQVDTEMKSDAESVNQPSQHPIPTAGITPNLNLQMQWIEDQKMFSMVYKDGDKAVFQVLMTAASFELLAMDMVRTVKNYNLYQAQKYEEMIKRQTEQSEQPAQTDEQFKQLGNDGKDNNTCSEQSCGGSLPCDTDAPVTDQTQPEQSPSDS